MLASFLREESSVVASDESIIRNFLSERGRSGVAFHLDKFLRCSNVEIVVHRLAIISSCSFPPVDSFLLSFSLQVIVLVDLLPSSTYVSLCSRCFALSLHDEGFSDHK